MTASNQVFLQAADEAPGPELNVSPALLTALQRQVTFKLQGVTVEGAAERLSEAADVPVEVDDSIAGRTIRLQPGTEPLWKVLESVARQGNLEIYPDENRLLLRAAGAGQVRQQVVPRTVQAQPAPGAAQAPARTPDRGSRYSKGGAQPEQRASKPAPADPNTRHLAQERADVWAPEWGNLRERGFQIPSPQDLPALNYYGTQGQQQGQQLGAPVYQNQQGAPPGGAAPSQNRRGR